MSNAKESKIILPEDWRRVLQEEIGKALGKLMDGTKKKATELVSRNDAAEELKVTLPTLHKWVKLGIIPKPRKIAGRVYFTREQLEQIKEG